MPLRGTRGANFTEEELDCFLDAAEDILPMSASQWESMAAVHMSRFPEKGHSFHSLKRKFKELHSKQILTGEPPLSAFCLLHKAALAIHHQ
jgi:hypothetical protein